jgi:uncharacterized protein YjhX (UPF0386 family)
MTIRRRDTAPSRVVYDGRVARSGADRHGEFDFGVTSVVPSVARASPRRHVVADRTSDGRAARRAQEDSSMAKAKRTTHRSSKGTKLYAKRDAKGRITDIQTFKRAHGADLRKRSKAETAAKAKKAAKKKA